MMSKILRSQPAAEPAALQALVDAEIGPEALTATDREMSRRFEAGDATFFSDAFEDIAHLAGAWWQYHKAARLWVRVTDPALATVLDERRPEFVESDRNHARRREIRRAARANPDTGERDES